MTKEEILHLANLARIKLSNEEIESFKDNISDILGYVSAINDIVADSELTKHVGPRYNVFREDEVTNEPGTYTEALMREMPERSGNYLKVKKILNQDT